MTTETIEGLLRHVNRDLQPSITGCQMHYREAVERFLVAEIHLEQEQRTLSILEEMLRQRRCLLDDWRRTPQCSRERAGCRSGLCGCSYGDLACYASLLRFVASQRYKVMQAHNQAHSCRLIANHIIAPRFAMLLDNPYCCQAFIEASYWTQEIDDNEWWLAAYSSNAVCLSGSPLTLELTVGIDPTYTIRWNLLGERLR